MENLTKEQLIDFIKLFAQKVKDNKDLLTQLDKEIGDGDHGINLNRGLDEVIAISDSFNDKDISEILKDTGMTLVKTVGGASGPLYGTAFLKAGQLLKDKDELEPNDILDMFIVMIDGIKLRGKSEQGEKTMLDAIIPAKEAFKEELEKGSSLKKALKEAEAAAVKGAEKTRDIKATKGRASYLGERSIGHQDPGATSMALLVNALNESFIKNETEEIDNEDTVGIVLVSHSQKIADGTRELALEMAPDARIISAGGMSDGSLGTDLAKITEAIEAVDSDEGVLVIIDLGSAFMTSEMAIDTLDKKDHVEIVDVPFVEGAIYAAIESALGSNKEKIKSVLEKVKLEPKL